jgi:capsid protein
MRDWTDLMVQVATEAAVRAALARVAAGETTAEEECCGVGRTCAEVRARAEGELRAWQQLGEDDPKDGRSSS